MLAMVVQDATKELRTVGRDMEDGPRDFRGSWRRRTVHRRPIDWLALFASSMAMARSMPFVFPQLVVPLLENTDTSQRQAHGGLVWSAASVLARVCGNLRVMRRCRVRAFTVMLSDKTILPNKVVRELQGDGRAILHPAHGLVQWEDWLDFKRIVMRTRIGDIVPVVIISLRAAENKMMAMALRPVADRDVRAAVLYAHRDATSLCAPRGGGAEMVLADKTKGVPRLSRRMCVSAPVIAMPTTRRIWF